MSVTDADAAPLLVPNFGHSWLSSPLVRADPLSQMRDVRPERDGGLRA